MEWLNYFWLWCSYLFVGKGKNKNNWSSWFSFPGVTLLKIRQKQQNKSGWVSLFGRIMVGLFFCLNQKKTNHFAANPRSQLSHASPRSSDGCFHLGEPVAFGGGGVIRSAMVLLRSPAGYARDG